MKKVVLFLCGFLIIVAGLLFLRASWVEFVKMKDYDALEKEILLPDTDNKGFSDKVKKDTDEIYKDEPIRKHLYKFAKIQRQIVRSKTDKEFIDNSKKSLINFACILYLERQQDKNLYKLNGVSISSKIVYDNEDMKNFIKF